MKAKHRQLITTGGLVALGLVVGVVGLLVAVLPQRSKANNLNAEIAAAQAKLISLHGRSQGPVIRAAQLFELARAMPNSADMPGIVVDLARAAAESKVSITSIVPSSPLVQTDGSTGLPMKLSVTGSWKGIDGFLRILRTNVLVHGQKLSVAGRLFIVDQVQLTANSGGAQTPTGPNPGTTLPVGEITASLNVNAFSYGTAPLPTTTGTTTTSTTTTSSPGTAAAVGSTG